MYVGNRMQTTGVYSIYHIPVCVTVGCTGLCFPSSMVMASRVGPGSPHPCLPTPEFYLNSGNAQ